MNTAQTHGFQAQIQGQFKRQKKIQGNKRILQKTYSPKIWILQNLEKKKKKEKKSSNMQKQGSKWPTKVWKIKKL
jgi:hypothetical protein